MNRAHYPALTFVLAGLLLVAWPGAAEDSTKPDQASKAPAAPEETAYQPHWYGAIGGSNYHPKLKDSEAQIDQQINGLFGILPGWSEPVTFRDWERNFYLWDMCFGIGRDISPRTSWMVWTGGATGTMESKEHVFPFETDIRFTRTTSFLTLQGYFYPLGKPEVDQPKYGLYLKEAKPYVSVATGWSFIRAKGDVRFEIEEIGRLLRIKQVYYHHMYQVSPRLGIEIPLGKNNSFTAEGMYYFFGPHHADEYNGPAASLCFKHQF